MNAKRGSHPAVRAAATALAAAVLVLGACEADLPTGAELDAMSAAEVVEAAAPLATMDGAVYIVDGVETDAATANAIAPDRIATIDIRKGAAAARGADAGAPAVVEITTHAAPSLAITGAATMSVDRVVFNSSDSSRIQIYPHPNQRAFDGLLLVDGTRVEAVRLRDIDPATIESIEVVKGAAAARMFHDPEARNGVISIRLKATP